PPERGQRVDRRTGPVNALAAVLHGRPPATRARQGRTRLAKRGVLRVVPGSVPDFQHSGIRKSSRSIQSIGPDLDHTTALEENAGPTVEHSLGILVALFADGAARAFMTDEVEGRLAGLAPQI